MNSNLEKRDVCDFSTIGSNMAGVYVYRPHSYYSSFTRIVDPRPVEKIQENSLDFNEFINDNTMDTNTMDTINTMDTNTTNTMDTINTNNTDIFEGIGDTDMTCYEDSCEIFEDMDMVDNLQKISTFNTESQILYPSFCDWGTPDSPFISIPL